MIHPKDQKQLSKFLSLILRHKPEVIGIKLDENGWTNVEVLIQKANTKGKKLSKEVLDLLVENSDKKRFGYNEDQTMIRANQGHSVKVDLGYQAQIPPAILFHGTAEKYVNSIERIGLIKKKRHHVHLSTDLETARKVGQRHGRVVIFEVLAQEMHQDEYRFFLSDNGVWLTDHVPFKYLRSLK